MKKFIGYMAGVNVCGYSGYPIAKDQYNLYSESDFAQIASWGCDHIRLPFNAYNYADYTKDNPIIEYALEAFDQILYWCKKHGLNLVFDMHTAHGFHYNSKNNTLFENRETQLQFIDAWRILAKRYQTEGANIAFDLLNETIVDGGCDSGSIKWNKLWREVADAIHEEAPQRKIIVGGNYFNCINKLDKLDIVDDDRIQYNFHSYFPMIFTHQRYDNPKYLTRVEWPFDSMEHAEFFGGPDKISDDLRGHVCIDHIREEFKPVAEFIEKYDKPLYCGEYGVCDYASIESKIRWLKDYQTVFSEYGIGHCVWEYTGFTRLVDKQTRKPVSDEIIRIISAK